MSKGVREGIAFIYRQDNDVGACTLKQPFRRGMMNNSECLLWGEPKSCNENGARIRQNGNTIIIEGEDYDADDNRQYQYCVVCTVEEYVGVVRRGGGTIKSSASSSRVIVSGGKGCSYFTILGTPSPCSTSAGTTIGESRFAIVTDVELGQLLPKE